MDVSSLLTELYGRIPLLARDVVNGGRPRPTGSRRPRRARTPSPGFVWHAARVQDHHVAELLGTAQLWTEGEWARRFGLTTDPSNTGYGHGAADVATVRPDGPEALIDHSRRGRPPDPDDAASVDSGGPRSLPSTEGGIHPSPWVCGLVSIAAWTGSATRSGRRPTCVARSGSDRVRSTAPGALTRVRQPLQNRRGRRRTGRQSSRGRLPSQPLQKLVGGGRDMVEPAQQHDLTGEVVQSPMSPVPLLRLSPGRPAQGGSDPRYHRIAEDRLAGPHPPPRSPPRDPPPPAPPRLRR